MGELVMSFRGLWMHVHATPQQSLPAGVLHRVVAVNASLGSPKFGGLPPHVCYLEVSSDMSAALQAAGLPFDQTLGSGGGVSLNGYRLTVANASAAQGLNVTFETAPPDVVPPHLKDYDTNMKLLPNIQIDTGAPSDTGAGVLAAACYADISLGNVTAHKFSAGGIYTTWTVLTDGDPILQLIGQDGKPLQVVGTAGISLSTPPGFTLSDGVPGSVVLHNSTTDLSDKEFDFALNYLAAEGGIPDNLRGIPGSEGQSPSAEFVDMTTSCSNSQYP
ncbi:MAG TPA: hypothetical protein VNN08_14995 [Thermoanaerobaculia bacterium]|nr:hypothetical protein [Thermoanaerobaculia bacterium]